MQKIPTIFERDWNGDRSRVLDKPHPDCLWVFAGEGITTTKLDGTCVMVRDGQRFKRRELREGEAVPAGFEHTGTDTETNKTVGWVPVDDSPADRWHREATGGGANGTYELIGPKVQGNPENVPEHILRRHGAVKPEKEPVRTFAGLKAAFEENPTIEGFVFHHPDGRMGKIKLRDFGIRRAK
jgi:hypothetical protein